MDVTSSRISLTAWGRLYGFDKRVVSKMHTEGRLPPELQVETLPNGRHYVIVPPTRMVAVSYMRGYRPVINPMTWTVRWGEWRNGLPHTDIVLMR